MKEAIKKRDLVRKPLMRSELKPGQILRLTDALEIKITRSLSARLTAEELDRESRPLAATEGPAVDSAALGGRASGMRHYADGSLLVPLLNPKDIGHNAALNH